MIIVIKLFSLLLIPVIAYYFPLLVACIISILFKALLFSSQYADDEDDYSASL